MTAPASNSSWWFAACTARLPMAKAPYRATPESSLRANKTIWFTAPARNKAGCESRFEANKARHRATSRRTSSNERTGVRAGPTPEMSLSIGKRVLLRTAERRGRRTVLIHHRVVL